MNLFLIMTRIFRYDSVIRVGLCLSCAVYFLVNLLGPAIAFADSPSSSEQTRPPHVSFSTDSLTWVLGGYSGIVTYEVGQKPKWRIHLEVFGLEFPESYVEDNDANKGEGWMRSIDWGVMLSVDHHPFRKVPGFHWGIGCNVQRSSVERAGIALEATFDTLEPLLRVGYQWYPFDDIGFFVVPYAALGFPIHLGEPDPVGGEIFQDDSWVLPVASVQMGWRFPAVSSGAPNDSRYDR